MRLDTPSNRRTAYRLEIYLPATFSLNGGAEISGHIIDLTHRSIALHGPVCVCDGDSITVSVGALPQIKGRVVRSFKGGFAIKTDQICLSLVAHARTQKQSVAVPLTQNSHRLISPPFSIAAPFPAWGRIAASCRGQGRSERHYLSLMHVGGFDSKAISSASLISKDMSWCARIALTGKRGDDSVLVLILNSWQLKNAAADGLTLEIIMQDKTVNAIDIPATALASHLAAFQPRKLQAHLLSKRPATTDSLSTMTGSRDSGGVITA